MIKLTAAEWRELQRRGAGRIRDAGPGGARPIGAARPPRARETDPTMAPTRGLTPVITGPGHKTYMHFEAKGAVILCWNDDERAPVRWIPLETCTPAVIRAALGGA